MTLRSLSTSATTRILNILLPVPRGIPKTAPLNVYDYVKIRPRKACKYPNLRSFGWVSYDKVGVLYSGKLGNRSEARASDLRSYPGLWWNRTKQRLYEGQ